ncbi:MAG: hypothetical protein IJ268_13855 [Proteobacteria bacterium]|nr:hypothetical protein [Pseudomonadota bacterium]MBQ9243598.1 hypothetical protein [Pseudomonadota bacterium]
MKQTAWGRQGVALVMVMLIVLSASAVALVSLKIMQSEVNTNRAFQYNRQAASAAHQAGLMLAASVQKNSLEAANAAHVNGIANAMDMTSDIKDYGNAQKDAWNARMQANYWQKPDKILPFSGLGPTAPQSSSGRLLGDLSKTVRQAASVGNQSLNSTTIPGFSNGDAYCSFTMHANSYALIGNAPTVRDSGGHRFYLLGDLNRVAGFKREMGVLSAEPVPCNQ